MDVLETIGSLPKKIGDVTTSISTGAVSLDTMVGKMDAAIKGVPTYNPVSGAIVGGLSKTTGALKKGTSAISNAGKKIQTVGAGVSTALQPIGVAAQTIKQSLQDLQNCQEIVASSALVVNAVVDSCSGHFHPRINEQVLNKFDGQWDSWAKTINGIYQQLSPTGQANILESLAKGGFGDKVFYLGSAIKNESAGIFGGIADFEDALHAFEGSYRNPIVAAKKIETGVKNIMNATERVANSINNMVKIYQKGMGQNVSGNPILSYIGNLHNTKAVSAINKALTAVGGTATLLSDASSLQNALKDKDPRAIYSAGKKTIDDAKTIIKDLKDADKARKVTSLAKGALTGGAAPVNQTAAHQQTPQKDSQDGSGNTDSYVCSGAKMKCSFGDKIAQLTVYPDRTVFLTGQPMANISDHTSLYNIAPFGKCHTTSYPSTGSATAANHGKLTPMPCIPGTNSNWMQGKNDYIIKGAPALLKSSFCRCCYGGVITITDDGQRDTGSADLSRALLLPKEQLNSNAEEKSKLDVDSVLDGIQTALDFAGFIPGAGAIPDLLNAAIYAARGDMANAGMSVLAAVPGIGDAAAGAKIAMKGVKAAKKAGKLTDGLQTGKKVNSELSYDREALRRHRAKMAGLDPDAPHESGILYNTAPEQAKNTKFLDLTKRRPKDSQSVPAKDNNPFGLTERDQWETKKEQTWDNVRKSQEQSSWNPLTVKDKPDVPGSAINSSTPKSTHGTPSPEDVLKDNKMHKYGDYKPKPDYNVDKGKPDVGKKIDFEA